MSKTSHQDPGVRVDTANIGLKQPRNHPDSGERFVMSKTSHQDPGVRVDTANIGLKQPRNHPDSGERFVMNQTSHQDPGVRIDTVNIRLEIATKTREYDLLRPTIGQKEPLISKNTNCYDQDLAKKIDQDSGIHFILL